jgi:hypothetical protein
MDNVKKFVTAVNTLKSGTEMAFDGEVTTEAGEDSNGSMISTTTCPHSEITWTKVKEEMDKL